VEILIPCPTGYGKKNHIAEGKESWDWLEETTILKSKFDKLSDEKKQKNQKMIIGELQNMEKKEFTEEWRKLVENLNENE